MSVQFSRKLQRVQSEPVVFPKPPPQWSDEVVELPKTWRLTGEDKLVDSDGFKAWRYWEQEDELDQVGPGHSVFDREHLTRPRIGAFDPPPLHVKPGVNVSEM
uniref:Uncharacterized protein n=1 Tax=Palpitomonas bilix TaxID=652834 RepID=A0A7S3D3F5_9EUKA|mmetsp:Transcript_20287/g.51907  ORF Transcript_20287/g.51907 Transcript_20287/m.51907 type:complete len:103 (+) Transcript_20287:200-508(+)